MNLPAISEWLKGTVPGIIILGSLGSIVAILLLWLLKKLAIGFWKWVTHLLPSAAKSGLKKADQAFDRFVEKSAIRMGRAKKIGEEAVIALLLYHALLSVVSLVIAASAGNYLVMAFNQQDEVYVTTPILVAAILVVLSLATAVRHFFPIWIEVICLSDYGVAAYKETTKNIEKRTKMPTSEDAAHDSRDSNEDKPPAHDVG